MKLFLSLLLCVSLLATGCGSTPATTEFKTISAAETAVTGAFNGYLDLVAQGKVATNSVPVVSRAFNLFQQSASLAILNHNFNPASPLPPELAGLAAGAIATITAAEGGLK